MKNGSVCIGKMCFCHLVKRAVRSRINQSVASDCRKFWPHRPSSTVYKAQCNIIVFCRLEKTSFISLEVFPL